MMSRAVARRYARGLFLVVDDPSAKINPERVAAQLEALASTVGGHRSLRALLSNPSVDTRYKRGIIEELLQRIEVDKPVRRFLLLLAEKERLDQLHPIAAVFRGMVDAAAGVLNAEVTTPEPLDAAATEALRQHLERASGRSVRMATRTDSSLMGGVVTRIGDFVYDGSVRHHLNKIRQRLAAG